MLQKMVPKVTKNDLNMGPKIITKVKFMRNRYYKELTISSGQRQERGGQSKNKEAKR